MQGGYKGADFLGFPLERWATEGLGRDGQKGKLYAAEDALSGAYFRYAYPTPFEVTNFYLSMQKKAWFKKRWPWFGEKPVDVSVSPQRRYGGASAFINMRKIVFGRKSMNKLIAVHEFAHLLCPDPGDPGHGRLFCATYLELVGFAFNEDAKKKLRDSFKKHKVKYRPKRVLSEEQREAARERFIKAGFSQAAKKGETP